MVKCVLFTISQYNWFKDRGYDELHEMVVLKIEQKNINKNRIGQFRKDVHVQDLYDR